MDKYAVDLDQLLNDFEYSELTDSYPPVQRNTESTSYSQNNVVKHSINNVFHSLNEYLNTDITPKLNTSASQSIKNDITIKDNGVNELPEENHNVYEKQELVNKNSEVYTNNVQFEDSGGEVGEPEILIDVKPEFEDNLANSQRIQDETIDSNYTPPLKESAKQLVEECKQIIEENQNHIEESIGNEIKNELSDSSKADFINDCDELEELNNHVSNEAELLSIDKEIKTESAIEENINYENSVKIIENEETVVEKNSDVECNLKTESIIDLNISNEQKEEENSCQNVQNNVVGFDNYLEVDDNELLNQLEQLEDELKDEDVEPDIKIVDNLNNEMNVRASGDNELVLEESADKEVDNNMEDNIKEQIVLGDIVNSVEVEKRAEVDVNQCDKEINDEPVPVVLKSSEENPPRPDNLPLNDANSLESKKINLIGDPGSTPYNNVYKDLPKEKPVVQQESDSEYSTSASPTFSDASTIDTASTCSADNVPPISQKQYKKDPRNKANIYRQNHGLPVDTTSAPENANTFIDQPTAGSEEAPVTDEDHKSEDESASPPPNQEVGESSEDLSESKPPDGVQEFNEHSSNQSLLGKKAPYWMPDHEADKCLHCEIKFTVIKRRHHCRACGKVLCSKCCNLKYKLAFLDAEARVCSVCHEALVKMEDSSSSGSETTVMYPSSPLQRPNPNNPAEYCSTVSPLEQVGNNSATPPAVMVPVGVLKRKGSNKAKTNKTVMFCDGIRPGSDLTNLDNDFNYNNTKTLLKYPEKQVLSKIKTNIPQLDPTTKSFIPSGDNDLPPMVTVFKSDITYTDCQNNEAFVETLKKEQVTFALNLNLYIHLKIVTMDCCVNKTVWCFSTEGLINVGQDEILILLEVIEGENIVPKDMFYHINSIHQEAVKGSSVKEMGLSLHNATNFLDSKNHAGFVFIKPSFQCLQNIVVPKEPYLIGILIHKWETPWAKLFPLRLVLRFGALYRYYPSPIISTRHRDSVFVEIGHTIINLLADFRNYSYTLPQIRGLTIHMEDKNTTITIPANRYDQVMKSMSNSTDHILAFAGNFSREADSHLVCIQDTQDNENCYSTHAINIHNKPRKVTGASFIVFNGALKSSSGLMAKSNIVEDGLMIQVLPEHMVEIRESLRSMKNYTIQCGCVNSTTDENVHIVWGENDTNFNAGVLSPIDNMSMAGIPSIRVHNGKDFICGSGNRLIRWTEVFIIQNNDDSPKNREPVDVSKVSESIARATCSALVKYLDLLVSNNFYKIGIRTTLHVENVSYSAGANNMKLPPIYMKSLDNELIPVLHRITSNNLTEHAIVLELVFRILNT